jgi:hypothetical protein
VLELPEALVVPDSVDVDDDGEYSFDDDAPEALVSPRVEDAGELLDGDIDELSVVALLVDDTGELLEFDIDVRSVVSVLGALDAPDEGDAAVALEDELGAVDGALLAVDGPGAFTAGDVDALLDVPAGDIATPLA